jgi:hypothetical protein
MSLGLQVKVLACIVLTAVGASAVCPIRHAHDELRDARNYVMLGLDNARSLPDRPATFQNNDC